MTTHTLPLPAHKRRERLDRDARTQLRFYQAWRRQGHSTGRARVVLTPIDGVLLACLTLCLLAIGMGLDRMYPVVRPAFAHALNADLPARPFPDCADARAAGVSNIPVGAAAYTVDQDADRDGLACESL